MESPCFPYVANCSVKNLLKIALTNSMSNIVWSKPSSPQMAMTLSEPSSP